MLVNILLIGLIIIIGISVFYTIKQTKTGTKLQLLLTENELIRRDLLNAQLEEKRIELTFIKKQIKEKESK